MNSVSTDAGQNSITIGTSGAVGLEASGLPNLLPYLTPASNGTLVVTLATSADAVNLAAYFLNSLSLGALDSETYAGLLTPSGTNYRLGGGGGAADLRLGLDEQHRPYGPDRQRSARVGHRRRGWPGGWG